MAWLLAGAYALYALHAVYAIACSRFLFMDGAYYMVRILERADFVEMDSSRRFGYWITQAPLVLALRAGLRDRDLLLPLFGAAHFATLPLSLAVCHWAARADWRYLAFPLLATFAGTLNTEMFVASESRLAVALFWPLLLLMLLRNDTFATALTALMALPALRVYESMLVLGLILGAAAGGRAARAAGLAQRAGWLLLALWFLAGSAIALESVIHPRHPAALATFLRSTVFFVHRDFGVHHMGLLSLVLVALATLLLLRPVMTLRSFVRGAAGFAGLAVALALWPWLRPTESAPGLHYPARVMNAYLSVPLALGAILLRFGWLAREPTRYRRIIALTAVLGMAQCAWNVAASHSWDRYLVLFRRELECRRGFIPFAESALARLPIQALPSSFNTNWTMPVMSLLLSNRGSVKSIVGNPPSVPLWMPYDPTDLSALPRLAQYGFDDGPYRTALAQRPAPGVAPSGPVLEREAGCPTDWSQ